MPSSSSSSKTLALQNALVLHTRPYQNSSLLVDFFTEKNGLIRCVAKGQRSKKNASLLSQFCIYQIGFSGKSDLKTLVHLDVPQRRFLLKKEALYSGLYINEVLLRVLHNHDPHPEVFKLSFQAFEALEALNPLLDASKLLEAILRRFEFNLLKDIGYLVDMEHDCDSGKVIEEQGCYAFDNQRGFYSVVNTMAQKQKTFSGKTLRIIAGNRFNDFLEISSEYKAEAKILSRLMLAPYLGDKPLQSKTLFSKPQVS